MFSSRAESIPYLFASLTRERHFLRVVCVWTHVLRNTDVLTLEEGDWDLELSPLSICSSFGDMVTSGTGVNSTSWNDEGLERGIKSVEKGLFPSDTRLFGTEAPSF